MNALSSEDLGLARAVITGEPCALERLMRVYGGRLYRFAYYQVGGNHEDAQDVLQETLLGAVQCLPSYRGDSSLYSWLCGVAWNKAVDFRRHCYRVGRAEDRFHSAQEALTQEGQADAEAALIRQAEGQRVREVLRRLRRHYREVLLLRYADDLGVDDIARRMGRSYKATESLLSRARVEFRELYRGGQL